jgi:hypothetical protein
VEEVLAGSFLDDLPARLIGDKAYDLDPLDEKLDSDYGIEMIAPNRKAITSADRSPAGSWFSGFMPPAALLRIFPIIDVLPPPYARAALMQPL